MLITAGVFYSQELPNNGYTGDIQLSSFIDTETHDTQFPSFMDITQDGSGKYMELLNINYDAPFKLVFGSTQNEDVTINFINDVCADVIKHKVKNIEFLKTEMDGVNAQEAKMIVDVMCEDTNGNKFILEIQNWDDANFVKRSGLYVLRKFCNQISERHDAVSKNKPIRADYDKMRPVYLIAVATKNLFPNSEEYITYEFPVRNNTYSLEGDKLRIVDDKTTNIYIETQKFKKDIDQCNTHMDLWIYVFLI